MTPRPSKIEASHLSCSIREGVRRKISKVYIYVRKIYVMHEHEITLEMKSKELETTYNTSRVVKELAEID